MKMISVGFPRQYCDEETPVVSRQQLPSLILNQQVIDYLTDSGISWEYKTRWKSMVFINLHDPNDLAMIKLRWNPNDLIII